MAWGGGGWGGGGGGGWRGGGPGGGPGLQGIDDVDSPAYNPQVTRRALAYVRPYRRRAALAIFLTVYAAAMNTLGPFLVKLAIDQHIAKGDLVGLSQIVGLTICVYLAAFGANQQQTMIISVVGQNILRTMREQMVEHLQKLPLHYFDEHPSGVIVSRVINDVQTMNDLLTTGLMQVFADLFTLIFTITAMLLLSWKLALVTFAVMPLMPVAVWIFTQKAKKAYRLTRESISAVTADLAESISGMRVVQAFARQERSQSQFDQLNMENRIANVRANTLSSMLMPIIELTSAMAIVAVVAYGGHLIVDGGTTLGVIVAFLAYVTRFFEPIRTLTQFYAQLQAATAGAEKAFSVLDQRVNLFEAAHPVHMEDVRGEVEFRDVTFSYGREPVLQRLSLHADPGEMIALVGHTGAGKTTVASLLARFYDPVEGQILIDGYDLRDLSFETLRRNVALVLQDNFLFSGTIADNIRYGKPDATDEAIERAARVANAHDFISRLPQAYDTHIMERATNLSLGQRQLIAIARAVLADPRVLILDEATSNIDPHTERLVQQALQSLLRGRTSVIIAHRLSTIRAADQVLVLDRGEVIEKGRHEELLRSHGPYYKLYQQQFEAAAEVAA
ncbi:MAG: ABC transporter ATP-binding protein [Chloroflexi bacterium]|nr:ABC transporter ATP-binding protein [Chloroflexota bacterium]